MTTPRALLYGTLTVGILDGADAVLFFGLRGVSPLRVFQAIASGLLGRQAFAGGLATAALGWALHFLIASAIVATYLAASRRRAILVRRPIACGILYGIGVYLVMNVVVIPLSAAVGGAPSWPVILNGVLIHMFGVGLPSSLFARAASAESTPGAQVQR